MLIRDESASGNLCLLSARVAWLTNLLLKLGDIKFISHEWKGIQKAVKRSRPEKKAMFQMGVVSEEVSSNGRPQRKQRGTKKKPQTKNRACCLMMIEAGVGGDGLQKRVEN